MGGDVWGQDQYNGKIHDAPCAQNRQSFTSDIQSDISAALI